MVPLRLALRNFLSYRDDVPALDFAGIPVACCLCGDNGAGKSALLDAITWALWGKARAGTLDELIHMGQQEMEVDLLFLGGETRYRVLRKRRRGGPTILELQVAGPDGFRPLTGNSAGETQQKIIDLLHMDYETFVNSAFLRQGRADEFTRSAPAQRKEVLGRILDLALYEELAEEARQRARERRRQAEELQRELQRMEAELAQLPGCERELQEAREEQGRLQGQLGELERDLEALTAARAVLAGQQQRLERLRQQEAQAQEQLRRLDERIQQQRGRLARYRLTLAQEEAIRQGYQSLQQARQEETALGQRLSRLLSLKQRQAAREQEVALARQKLEGELERGEASLAELEALASSLAALAQELRPLKAALEDVHRQEEQAADLRQQAQGAQAEAQALERQGQQLEQDTQELKRKLQELAGADSRCPLCGTELGLPGKDRVEEHYRQEMEERSRQAAAGRQRARELARQGAAWEREARALEQELARRREDLLRREAQVTKALDDAQQAQEALPGQREAVDSLRRRQEARAYAPESQEELAALGREMGALAYDGAAHQALRRQVEELATYEESYRQLGEAEQLAKQEEEALAQAAAAREEEHRRWQEFGAEAEELAGEISRQPDIEGQLAQRRSRQQELLAQRDRCQQLVGALGQEIDRLRRLAQQREEHQKDLKGIGQEREIYEELAAAFGKGGLQALLIDDALPQIEEEANRLLSRMTAGRIHVALSTQKETQKGEPRESLEIRIADELGERSYELFSGGEAFRVDFALRVALAKLLARRHGAPLPTLIIDEGFGSQDSAGRERLVEAINAVQDDFRRILVITHLDELKEAFPARIEVTKTPTGSVFAVAA